MEGYHVEFAHWTDWFPVEERLLEGALADQPLLVDVGGGRGHDLVVFKERFPVVPQQLVLEDLPSVIKDTEYLDDGIRRVGHDFFKPQPIEGL